MAPLVRTLVIALAVIWSAVPIAFAVLASFKNNREIFDWPPRLIFTPTLSHYADLFRTWPAFAGTLANSVVVTVGATLLSTACSLLAGYVYSRHRGRWLATSAHFMVVIRLLPPIIITLPLFPLADWLGLSDTWTILILLYAAFFVSLGTMVLKASIDTIPLELDESARIDGASEWQVLLRVIAPLAVHGLIAASVFVFIYAWNEYLFAFVFTTSRAKTAPLILAEMMSSLTGVDWGVLFAAVTVQLVPVLVFVWVVQRWLVAGLTGGAVKA
ncbi:MAG TPA: carbohydrate ABC transporter permease [Acetobacteraceae bacterium]|nr:carbohydrate ABC transporter permease [Acetobacteraceae bacterium]